MKYSTIGYSRRKDTVCGSSFNVNSVTNSASLNFLIDRLQANFLTVPPNPSQICIIL